MATSLDKDVQLYARIDGWYEFEKEKRKGTEW